MSALDSNESSRILLGAWVENLAEIVKSMTDARPAVTWQVSSGTPIEAGVNPDADILWWQQPCSLSPEATFWLGAPRPTWEHVSSLTLKAAGIETSDPAETKDTWLEIVGQWGSALARELGHQLGRELNCGTGLENMPPDGSLEWIIVSLAFDTTTLAPVMVALSAPLVAALTAPLAPRADSPSPNESRQLAADPQGRRTPSTMDLLLDVELPVSISFGKTHLPLKDVLKLTTGSIVELNRGVNEPVEVLVNHFLVARGEVVVVDGNYGIRIQQISSPQDRLRSLR